MDSRLNHNTDKDQAKKSNSRLLSSKVRTEVKTEATTELKQDQTRNLTTDLGSNLIPDKKPDQTQDLTTELIQDLTLELSTDLSPMEECRSSIDIHRRSHSKTITEETTTEMGMEEEAMKERALKKKIIEGVTREEETLKTRDTQTELKMANKSLLRETIPSRETTTTIKEASKEDKAASTKVDRDSTKEVLDNPTSSRSSNNLLSECVHQFVFFG